MDLPAIFSQCVMSWHLIDQAHTCCCPPRLPTILSGISQCRCAAVDVTFTPCCAEAYMCQVHWRCLQSWRFGDDRTSGSFLCNAGTCHSQLGWSVFQHHLRGTNNAVSSTVDLQETDSVCSCGHNSICVHMTQIRRLAHHG